LHVRLDEFAYSGPSPTTIKAARRVEGVAFRVESASRGVAADCPSRGAAAVRTAETCKDFSPLLPSGIEARPHRAIAAAKKRRGNRLIEPSVKGLFRL
jgi:hypothetical protein